MPADDEDRTTRADVEPARHRLASLLALPNLISLSRLPLALAYALADARSIQLVVLFLAAASDFFDGWFARRLKLGSNIGQLLDPITDRVFVVTALAALAHDGVMSIAQLGVVLARDIYTALAFGIAALMRFEIPFRARFSGKVVTTLQLGAILALTLDPGLALPVVATLAATCAWAIFDYTIFGVRSLRRARAGG